MNVKISYNTQFIAAVWWNNSLVMSTYDVVFNLLTAGINPANTNISLDRLKYIVEEYLNDQVFVNHTEKEQIKRLQSAGINVIIMPEEPVDQIIGMMLYSKISAVMEGHILVRSIMLSSTTGDNVIYEHNSSESLDPFTQPGWWNAATPVCEDEQNTSKGKIVEIVTGNHWRELDLDWVDNSESEYATVLEFKKNEEK